MATDGDDDFSPVANIIFFILLFLLSWAFGVAVLDYLLNVVVRRQRLFKEYADRGVVVNGRVLNQQRHYRYINGIPHRKTHHLTYAYACRVASSDEDDGSYSTKVFKKQYSHDLDPCANHENFDSQISLVMLPGYPASAFPKRWIEDRGKNLTIHGFLNEIIFRFTCFWGCTFVMAAITTDTFHQDDQLAGSLCLLYMIFFCVINIPVAIWMFQKWKKDLMGPAALTGTGTASPTSTSQASVTKSGVNYTSVVTEDAVDEEMELV